MRLGSCPKCKSNLEEYDHYFCSKCGFQLPLELINSDVPFNCVNFKLAEVLASKKHTLISSKVRTHLSGIITHVTDVKNRKTYLIGVLVLLLGVFSTQVYGTYIVKTIVRKPINIGIDSVTVVPAFDMQLDLAKGLFTEDSLVSYIPSTADLYARVNDVNGLNKVFGETVFSNPDLIANVANYAEIFRVTTDKGGQWSILFKLANKDSAQEFVKRNTSTFWSFRVINDVLVATTDGAVFNMVSDSINHVSLNLNLNPKFVISFSRVPKDGKVLIILLNDQGKEDLLKAKDYIPSELFAGVVEAILKSGYNEIVIN